MSTNSLIAPFDAWLVQPDWADRVITRAYDNLSPEERRDLAEANPHSYVTVTRSFDDVAPGETATLDELVAEGTAAFSRLIEVGAFAPTGRRTLYLYRMTTHGRSQTGVVGTIPVEGLIDGRIRTHESVRPRRTALLTRHLQEVGASSSPIATTFRTSHELALLMAELTTGEPDLDHKSTDSDVRHEMWIVAADRVDELIQLLDHAVMYVTDGHHRAAAALAAYAERSTEPAFSRTLGIAFPEDHLHIDAFHRMVADSLGRSSKDILAVLQAKLDISELDGVEHAHPTRAGEVGMYCDDQWFRFELPRPAGDSPVDRLDVERLRAAVLDPVFGANELGQTGAVAYVPEPSGVEELVRRCDQRGCFGFVVHPTSIEELMAVADARQLMPPKSSYFSPKPRAGVFLRMLGTGATAHLPPS